MADAQFTGDNFNETDDDDELENGEADSVDELSYDDAAADDDDDGATLDTDDEVEEEVVEDIDEAEEEEESLDILLSRDSTADDDVRLDGEAPVLTRVSGSIAAGEFTCQSCFLVKRRAQLADEERLICLDCA